MVDSDEFLYSGYFSNERPEILHLVDKTAKMILDVGCGMGRLGSKLKERNPRCKVYGVERNENAASEARKVLDGAFVGDIQTMEIPFQPMAFDCIIFADVLEHLVDPRQVLHKLKNFLKPDGVIVCSIPNMRHYTVILRLIIRGWEYEDYGLFDRTHLRFFSLGSMKKLLEDVEFRVERVEARIVASKKMRLLNTIFLGKLEEFVAFQYLIRARNDINH